MKGVYESLFTENKALINVKTVQIYQWISQQRLIYQKIHLLEDAAFDADCLLNS